MVAMLCETIIDAKATFKTILAQKASACLGYTEVDKELNHTLLAAVWRSCYTLQGQLATRRARMEEDPPKVPEINQDDQRVLGQVCSQPSRHGPV